MNGKKRTPLLKHQGLQTLVSSLMCIALGLVVGYIALMIINPIGAGKAIKVIVQNFMSMSSRELQLKNLGNTLVKTAPLVMCSLSVLFAYKVGLFNIGAAGQYVAGAGLALYCALALDMPWYLCMLAAMLAGALLGVISGAMKAWLNVNEVISCIMLNWITLYSVNMLLVLVKHPTKAETLEIREVNPEALIPNMGLGEWFNNNSYVTIAIPMMVVFAALIWVLLSKTKLGYELRATGSNKHAAKYAGMREKYNLVLTMAIAGGLAGLGAGMFYLTGYEQWNPSMSSVPGMGFNGIAAAFLGGLHPIGVVFSSYFIQHVSDGGAIIDKSMYFSEISDLIAAVIIYLCGFVLFFRGFFTKLNDRVEEAGGWRVALFSKRNLPKTIAVLTALVIIIGLGVVVMKDAAVLTPLKDRVVELESSIAKQSTESNEKTRIKNETEAAKYEQGKAEHDARAAALTEELAAANDLLAQQTAKREQAVQTLTSAIEQYAAAQDASGLTEALSSAAELLAEPASEVENEGEGNQE